MNPARSAGPAVLAGGWAMERLWLFQLASIVGAALTGVSCAAVAGQPESEQPATGKDPQDGRSNPGGAVFLIPGFLAFFVLGKVFGMLKSLAEAIGPRLGIASVLGGVLLDVAAIAAIVLVCFLGGLVARRATAQRMRTKVDQVLLGSFPGCAFVKGLAESMQQSQEIASSFVPVLVRFDDYWQVAFETDRMPEGVVSVYLPGAPNPWPGSVVLVLAERIRKLPVSITEALKIIRALGRGSEALAAELRTLQGGNQCSCLSKGS